MDGWSPVNINVKVHINLFFVLFFFCVYCVALFLKVYWKAFLALFQLLDLEKKKTQTQQYRSHENYYTVLPAVVQSWNFDLPAYIGGEAGRLIISTV